MNTPWMFLWRSPPLRKRAQLNRSEKPNATVDGRVHEKKQRYPAGSHTPFLHVFAVDEGCNLSGGARQLLRRYARRDAAG
eukprot:9459792-Prorocentrum_lima.AAC.1